MSVSKEFIDVVSKGNELRTKIILSNYMVVDPTFHLFDESLEYAKKSIPDLVVPHDGEELNYDISAWTKDYYNRQSANLIDNFSQERIELLRNMCAYLYKDRISASGRPAETAHPGSGSRPSINPPTNSEKRPVSRKQVGAVTAGAGAVVTVTGLALSSVPVTVIGAIAAVTGGILILTDK